jgi:hypothetical protein
MNSWKISWAIALAAFAGAAFAGGTPVVEKLMAHSDPGHTGWNSQERTLTPEAVKSGGFGLLWSSPQLDSFNDTPPRLFAAPLYRHAVKMTGGEYRGKSFATAFVSTTTGYAYAISTAQSGNVQPGTILWKTRLTENPCSKGMMGNYSTPIIDAKTHRIYLTSCTTDDKRSMFSAHALDLRSGQQLEGWPVEISRTMIEQPALNRNGTRTWRFGGPGYRWVQRGALNLSADASRLYVAFGADGVGWMVVVDTAARKVASAFSATPNEEQDGGGMWAAGGPAIDPEGRIYMTTGSNLRGALDLGLASIYADSEHSWAHSILQWTDDRANGLTLTGTYTPYNYCQAAKADIDIGSSAPIVVDLPAGTSATPRLLVLAGGKQGNIYLLDRDRMPGNATKRHPCTIDPADDSSLLAPEPQPEWKRRGPINLFKPFSDEIGAYDQAKSRTTASIFRDESGTTYVYINGASKKGENFNTSMPPGLAKVKIVTSPNEPAFLRVDKLETKTTFHNPGSPIVTSNGARGAIVWMVDQNAPRTANLYQNPPKPFFYAYDALTLELLWQSAPGELYTTGNYSEPTILNGLALVGTDRLQAFGMKQPDSAGFVPLFDGKTLAGWRGDPAIWSVRDGAITGGSEQPLPSNTFLIYDKPYADFELRYKYRINGSGNSGVQFRSYVADESKFAVKGVQANVVPTDQAERFGMLWDEGGRSELALLGHKMVIGRDADGKLVETVTESTNPRELLLGKTKQYPDWNEVVVIAYGPHIVHALNDYVVFDALDNDPQARKDGIFAIQAHSGPPMYVQFKDVRVKRLTAEPDLKGRFITNPGPPTPAQPGPRVPRK